MLQDIMPGTEELLSKEQVTAYLGIDPTADSTGTVSLYHHRIFFITFRSQQNDIVTTFQTIERMIYTHFLQAD